MIEDSIFKSIIILCLLSAVLVYVGLFVPRHEGGVVERGEWVEGGEKVNAEDRRLMSIIHRCVTVLAALYPSNPANIEGIVKSSHLRTRCLEMLDYALESYRDGDYRTALDLATQALELIEK
jgi:hypothetical protein